MRKVPLLPAWLAIVGLFGGPFLHGQAQALGLSEVFSENIGLTFAIGAFIAAGVVLWKQRSKLPAQTTRRRGLVARALAAIRRNRNGAA